MRSNYVRLIYVETISEVPIISLLSDVFHDIK